jgi:hypothetical protein
MPVAEGVMMEVADEAVVSVRSQEAPYVVFVVDHTRRRVISSGRAQLTEAGALTPIQKFATPFFMNVGASVMERQPALHSL